MHYKMRFIRSVILGLGKNIFVVDNQPQAKKVVPNQSKDKAKEFLDIPKVNEVLEPMKKEKETKEIEELVSPLNIEH
jgi:hypothetical protein